jgi:hypothetical protein
LLESKVDEFLHAALLFASLRALRMTQVEPSIGLRADSLYENSFQQPGKKG